jgi:hypothetical protein
MSDFAKESTPLLLHDSQLDERMPMTVIKMESSAISTASVTPIAPKERMASLDQYRGFIVLCLIVVPLLGQLNAAPDVFRHKKNFFSLAGTLERFL